MGEEIIGYRDFESKLSRLNSSGEALWTFDLPLRDSSSNDPDNLDHLEKVLGIAQGRRLDLYPLVPTHSSGSGDG